jgi:hypothetical protein
VRLGLLDVVQDALAMGVADDAAKVGCSVVGHAGSQNHSLAIFLLEQTQHLLQRERTADIGIEDEEAVGAAFEDRIAEVVETTSGSECLVFAQVLHGDLWVCAGAVLNEVAEDCLIVVTNNEDLVDLRQFGDRSEAV